MTSCLFTVTCFFCYPLAQRAGSRQERRGRKQREIELRLRSTDRPEGVYPLTQRAGSRQERRGRKQREIELRLRSTDAPEGGVGLMLCLHWWPWQEYHR